MNARLLAFTIVLVLVISGCGQQYNPKVDKDCPGCDLSGANLMWANLKRANLEGANLTGADLTRADLSGFRRPIGADLAGAEIGSYPYSSMRTTCFGRLGQGK